ncbi:MAG: LON peptidase substrate-binding domain-containing protein [Burkholderiaceae bacterium]|nr:LON peptidase substrate-binding domain-containing protein [Burkholderiaceae bacterium]
MDTLPTDLTRLPLFPLQCVLFPGGYLPLRIFEVRYLDMIGRAHKAGTPFGVVCLTAGREVRAAPSHSESDRPRGEGFPQEAFHEIGTLASITQLERPNPGLMTIGCTGTQRFRIRSREQLKHGLWVADVELLSDDVQVGVPGDLESVAATLREVVKSMVDRAGRPLEMPFQPPYRWDDCGWLANRWCELLPLGAEQKQRLLELENPLLRLELVADVLDQTGLAKSLSGRG